MSRLFAFVLLFVLLAGCTRYGTNPPGGPFARKPKQYSDPSAVIPPGPPATSSPLALATPTLPVAPGSSTTPEQYAIIPPRPPEPDATGNAVIPAGGIPPDANAVPTGFPRRPRQPDQLPSPFAPREPVIPAGAITQPAPLSVAQHVAEVKKLATFAADQWAKVNTYEAIVTCHELEPNKEWREDVVLYQYRKNPMAVYIRNIGESGKGREVVYNPTKYGDKIHAIIGKGDEALFLKVGDKAPAVSPDFPMVKDKTRYSIREAGYGTPIARVGNWVAKAEAGGIPAQNLTYVGEVNRREYPYPLVGVQLKLRPGDDPYLPRGGMRQWFFDMKPDSSGYGFPVLIIATEPNGKEVEYYLFEKLNFGVKLTDADFSPDRLGKR